MMSQPAEEKSQSLRRTIIGAIILASCIPLALVLWVVHVHLGAAFSTLTHENIQSIADRHSTRIDTFVEERLKSVSLVRHLLGDALFEPQVLSNALKDLQNIYGQSIVDMGLVNAQGLQEYYAGPLQLEQADYASSLWFEKVLQEKTPLYVSDVFLGLRNTPHFIVAFYLEYRGQPWILRATIDFGQFSQIVREIRVGTTGTACIINTAGEYQTAPLPSNADTQELTARAKQIFGPQWQKTPVRRTLDEGGYLYAMSLLKDRQWALVVRVARDDAFARVTETERALDIILALVSLAVLGGGVLISWRIMNRIDTLERERLALNEHLVQASKLSALGEMAAGIAHEINNPVAIMMEEAGWIEDLLMDMPKDGNTEEIESSVSKIRTQGARCRTITHKLLGFARKSDEPDQAVDVGTLLREMVALTNEKARNAGVSISVSIAQDLRPVVATPSVLQQIFLNLFNNAVDAMENSGGSLTVKATVDADAPVPMVLVAVADSGTGIPPKVLKRIFDPFFTTKAAGKGTGLGLSICYGIVQGLGGHIRIDSVEGEGTTFFVSLPTA